MYVTHVLCTITTIVYVHIINMFVQLSYKLKITLQRLFYLIWATSVFKQQNILLIVIMNEQIMTTHIIYIQHRYRGGVDVLRSIVAKDGVLGLWKGWVPNCQRAAVVCLGGE